MHGKDDWEVIVLASKPFNDNVDSELNEYIPEGVEVNYDFIGLLRPLIKLFSGGSKKKKVTKSAPMVKVEMNVSKPKKKLSYTPFDQYLWDVNGAIRCGSKLIEQHKPDVIWVNADPWSGFLVARSLSNKFEIPWVADMRDPWSIFKRKMDLRPSFTQNLIKKYEAKFFTSASRVVLNSSAAYEEYLTHYSLDNKFTFIRNAFNNDLLSEKDSRSEGVTKSFTFGYYGGFRDFVPSNYILQGFATFIKDNSLDPSHVKLEVVGSVYDEFWKQVRDLQLEDFVVFGEAINSSEAIGLLRSWDVLLIYAIEELRWQMPAKFYDYLYARKPMLAVSDNLELNRLIDETESGKWARIEDATKTAELFYHYFKSGKTELLQNETLIKPFDSDTQAQNFRKILKEVSK